MQRFELRATVAAMPMVLLLGLAGCGKPTASGTYVAKGAGYVAMVEVVQSGEGQVTGRFESISLKSDGALAETSGALTGQSDGSRVSLAVQPNAFLPVSVQVTGNLSGDHLTLSGGNAIVSADFVRSDVAEFQKEAGSLHRQSATLLASQAAAEAQRQAAMAAALAEQQAAAGRAQLLNQIGELNSLIDKFVTGRPVIRTKIAQIEARYRMATQRMEGALERERRLVGPDAYAVQRGQIDVAINQLSVSETQFHTNAQSGESDLVENRQKLVANLQSALAACQGIGASANDSALTHACSGLVSSSKELSAFSDQDDQVLRSLEDTYNREAYRQRAIIAEADRIG
jgi:hypothetical protein